MELAGMTQTLPATYTFLYQQLEMGMSVTLEMTFNT